MRLRTGEFDPVESNVYNRLGWGDSDTAAHRDSALRKAACQRSVLLPYASSYCKERGIPLGCLLCCASRATRLRHSCMLDLLHVSIVLYK